MIITNIRPLCQMHIVTNPVIKKVLSSNYSVLIIFFLFERLNETIVIKIYRFKRIGADQCCARIIKPK